MPKLTKYELPRVRVKGWELTTIHTDPVSPGGLVWPVGLEVDPDVAPHLVVHDLKVGNNSQLIACGSVPASLFALSPPVDLRLDKLTPGLRFSVQVTCARSLDVTVRGRLLAAGPATPVPGKTMVVGFGYAQVGAGKTVDVVVSPQVELRVRRLHVPPHLLGVFRVDSLFQGRYLDVEQASRVSDSRQLGRENLSQGGEVNLSPSPDVGVGQPVTARVTNTSGTTRYFSAALLGEPVAGAGT